MSLTFEKNSFFVPNYRKKKKKNLKSLGTKNEHFKV
jgi:hypothetical protein